MDIIQSQIHHLASDPQQIHSVMFHLHSLKSYTLHRQHRHDPLALDYSQIGKQMQRAPLALMEMWDCEL